MPIVYLENEWTDEEAVEQFTQRDQQIGDLTAERDSLAERNVSLNQRIEKLEKELAETKKVNYTLAAQIPAASGSDPVGDFFKDILK